MKAIYYIKNIIFAINPKINGDKNKAAALKALINSLKNNNLFDPVQKEVTAEFCDILHNLSLVLKRIRNIYINNINGEESQYNDFQFYLCSNILAGNKIDINNLEFTKIKEEAMLHGKETSAKYFDIIFKSKLKHFKSDEFKSYKKLLSANTVLAYLSIFNFDNILNQFSKNKKDEFIQSDARYLIKPFTDLYYILSSLEIDSILSKLKIIHYAAAYSKLDDSYSEKEIIDDLYYIQSVLKENLKPDLLRDIIRLLQVEPELKLETIEINTNFPDSVYEDIIEKYRIKRQIFIQNQRKLLLQIRKQALFAEQELLPVQIYSTANSNLFSEAGLPGFEHIEPVSIIKSFYKIFWIKEILPALQELQLEGEFSAQNWKDQFQDAIEQSISISERVVKFEEDLTVPSFSIIHPFLKTVKESFLDRAGKMKARKAIEMTNERADDLVQDTFKAATALYNISNSLSVDIYAKNPSILRNAMFLNHKKTELCKNIEKSAEYFKNFIHLMRMFSVYMDDARKKISGSENDSNS